MKISPLLFLSLISLSSRCQDLLVNRGFEEVNTCSEYKVECAPEGWISSLNSIINFFKDPNRAHTGMNCMSVESGHYRKPFNRTIIRSRLLCGLRKGNSYRISFYVKSVHDVLDSVGIFFSNTDPLLSKIPFTKLVPSIYLCNVIAPINGKDSSWKEIEFDYRAGGDENYIAIGYFATIDFKGKKTSELDDRFFFFVDDISMIPIDPKESLCKGWKQVKEEIYEENERHEWLDRILKYRRSKPPEPIQVSRTTYVRIDTLVMPDIMFATGKAALESQSFQMLDSICMKINAATIDSVVIEGHTDSIGNLVMNQRLSFERALVVQKYIQQKTGYPLINSRGWAFEKPIGDNRTPIGRQKNRRVEVFLYMRE